MRFPQASISNFIAIAALVISVIALFESHDANRPAISVSSLPAYTLGTQSGESHHVLSLLRFSVANNGGRAVTLNGIRPSNSPPTVLMIVAGQNSAQPLNAYEFFRPNTSETNPVVALIERGRNDRILYREDYSINRKVEPGESLEIAIGFDHAEVNRDVEQLLISLEAIFSDGTSRPLTMALDAHLRRRGR